MDEIFLLLAALWSWFVGPAHGSFDVVASYWPDGLDTGPLCLTDIEDESVDIERDIAWPIDRLSVN